jgi:hypothetical protein
MSFTTVAAVTTFLNKETLTAFETNIVSMLIPFVDGVINNYCGTNLLSTDYVEKRFDGTGGDTLDLGVYPINTVTSVKFREDATTFTDVTTSCYFENNDGLLRLDEYADVTTFTSGTRNVFVTFNAGYVDGSVPSDLSYAASYLVAINFKRIANEYLGIEEGKFSEVDFKFDPLELPLLVKRVLDRYRVVAIY